MLQKNYFMSPPDASSYYSKTFVQLAEKYVSYLKKTFSKFHESLVTDVAAEELPDDLTEAEAPSDEIPI